MSEPFPDIATLNTGAILPPGPPSLTFPAIVGIAWELLSVYADYVVPPSAGDYQTIVVNGVAIFQLQPTANTRDSNSWNGPLVFPPNTAVVVKFGFAMIAGEAGSISAQARIR